MISEKIVVDAEGGGGEEIDEIDAHVAKEKIQQVLNGFYRKRKNENLMKNSGKNINRYVGNKVETIVGIVVLLVGGGFLIFIRMWEYKKGRAELYERIRKASEIIESYEGEYVGKTENNMSTITIYKTKRAGKWEFIPTLFLVEGDIVELGCGEEAPCLLEMVQEEGLRLNEKELYSTEKLKEWNKDALAMRGRGKFRCLETPLVNYLEQRIESAKKFQHNSGMETQAKNIKVCILKYLMPSVLVLLVAGVLVGTFTKGRRVVFSELLFIVLKSLLPISIGFLTVEIFKVLAVYYGNARVIVLFEGLKLSKTEFLDKEEVDEFDVEAPPPTKDITLTARRIFDQAFWIFKNTDYKYMSRSSKMVEVLSSITAFCSIDQEGTISQCVPEQLVVPTDGHGHPLILDIDISNDFRYGMRFAPVQMYEEIQIGEQADEYQPQGHYNYEDEHYTPQHSQLQQQSVEQLDWKQHIDKLLPIAKGILLQSNCSYGNRADNFTHSKNIEISKKAYCSGVYSECLCRLGNVIGVSSTNNGDVSPDSVVNVVAVSTTHPSIDDLDRKLALSLPVIHSTFVFPEIPNGKHEVQVYSSGDLDMILSLSDSIYDGERVLPLEEKLMDELYDIYKCTLMQDLQCVGFSFKSIKMTETKPENIVESFKTKLDLVSRSKASLRRKSTDQGKGKGKGNAHDQDRTGVGLVVLDNDWGDAEQTDISEHEVPHYLCNSTKLKREYKTARRKLGRKVDGMGIDELIGIDYISDEISEQPNQEFTNEIFDSQTFLGLLTFSDNPKPDVCDFIEDLSLAGIRFVYFSKTNMNQSKSFGEKLGLETDWNTTILLGRSGTDKRAKVGSRGGYFEDYEIKAQLPKGIQEIREHIKQVDDIPLQARLFAECEESSVAQMVDIFRENGDIVLGFGSVYTHSNAVVFDNCDIRIGVYPKYHSSFTSASVQGCSNLFHSCPSPFMFPSYAHSLPASHFAHLPQYEDSVNLGAVSPSVRISSALNPSILDLSSLLSGIDCSLFLPFDSSLYSILQLAAESRQFICSLQQTLLFALGCVLSLIIVNSIPLFFSLPPLVDSLSTMYLVCFTIPCISFTFLLSAPSSDIMTIMPSKNIFNSKGLISSILYGFLRILPIVINTLAIYLAVLSLTNDNSSLAKLLFSSPPPPSGAYTLATMFAFVELQISFSFFGLTMMDRLEPIVTYTSFKLFFTERLPFAIRSFSFKRFGRSSSNNVKSSARSFEHTKTSTAHSNITMPHPTPNAAAAVSFSTGAHLNNNNAATQTSAGTSSSKYFYFFLFVVALTLFSIAFSLVYTTYKHIPPHTISNVNFLVYIFGLVILPLCVLVPVNEYCKFCDKTRFVRSQKIKKLEFNTKLGLHSPL